MTLDPESRQILLAAKAVLLRIVREYAERRQDAPEPVRRAYLALVEVVPAREQSP